MITPLSRSLRSRLRADPHSRTRLAVAGLAALASLTLVSACTQKSPSNPQTSGKTAQQVLSEAAEKTMGQSFKYTLVYGEILTGDGSRDAKGNATRNITIKTGANGLSIAAKLMNIAGDRVFAKLDLGPFGSAIPGLGNIGDRWLVVNTAKLNPQGLSAALIPTADSSTVDSYVKGVVSAETVSATEIKGTVDLTKSAPIALPSSEVAKLTAEQRIVPFTATLDSEGRIVKTVVNMPAIAGYPAAPLTTSYSDYGSTAITITTPPESTSVDAPEAIYLLLP